MIINKLKIKSYNKNIIIKILNKQLIINKKVNEGPAPIQPLTKISGLSKKKTIKLINFMTYIHKMKIFY